MKLCYNTWKAAHTSLKKQIFSKQIRVLQIRIQRCSGKVNRSISFGHAERFAPKALSCKRNLLILEIK